MADAPALTIRAAPAGGIAALEFWSPDAAARVGETLGFALPPPGRSAGDAALRALRLEPHVWWLDAPELDEVALGEALGRALGEALGRALGEDGALTAIGGGLVRATLVGPGWRALLMADGVFDAEDRAFAPGCVAATPIAHVFVRLHVLAADACEAFVPASRAPALLERWRTTAATLGELERVRDFAR